MNLVLDIGNTAVKYAVFHGNKILVSRRTELSLFLKEVKDLFEDYPEISDSLVSSVSKDDESMVEALSSFSKAYRLNSTSRIRFINKYDSFQTLGVDRIALASAAFEKYPKKNVLVVDAGTCITYDIINEEGEYLGGAISPGMTMRYKAMHNQTSRLPLLNSVAISDFIGRDTESCMHSGVVNGIVQEIDGMINQYKIRFKVLTVILTGGDGHFFGKRLKNSIFADSNFLLEGLNFLLEYNKD